MKKIFFLLSIFLFTSAFSAFATNHVQFMSKEELKERLNIEDIVILDGRSEHAWNKSKFKIPGAIRAAGNAFEEWSEKLSKEKAVVLYCS